jgi:maltoporin
MKEQKRIIDLYFDEFEKSLEQILDSKINSAFNNLELGDNLLSRKQVIKRLGIAPSTLTDYTHKGIFKSYRIGHRVYYKWSEILNAAKEVNYYSPNNLKS